MKKNISRYGREKYLTAFLLGFSALMICFIPIMTAEKGYFIYYGDYNAQQIPFYNLLNDAIRSRSFGWNWLTDLGSDLLTSYSFYLICSPFFWLTVLLPRSLVTFSMPVILSIKHGMAAMTAYAYIRRFVRNKNMAVVGGLLYAFSGFQIFNIFFNHFQDVTALFPLMLIAMEENVNNGRKGWFALIVALMAMLNYYFFAGQCVFLIIYYFIRALSDDFRLTQKKFMGLALEAVTGVMISGFVILPSAMLLMGNYRLNEHLYGQDMVIYSDSTVIPRIIQSFFMPVDVPARPNLFRSDYEKWASIGGYFPLFSMIGVITFMRTNKKHWATRLSLICIVFAFIPILNSLFQLGNGYYYARWFYMPILIFAMMTARTLDDEEADVMPAIKINAVFLIAYGITGCLPEWEDDRAKYFSFASDNLYFFLCLGVAAASLAAAGIIFSYRKNNRCTGTGTVWATVFTCIVCTLTAILYGADSRSEAIRYINSAVKGGDGVYEEVSEDNFFRVDISNECDNYTMIWGLPNMRAFQSVVNPSIMNFYNTLGIQRDVASRADISHYTLRGLLSVKYYYRQKVSDTWYLQGIGDDYIPSDSPDEDINPNYANISKELTGFEYVGENEYFEIYENKLYVPMGFAYDTYITEKKAEDIPERTCEKILMKALVLSDEQIEKYSDILEEVPETLLSTMTRTSYEMFCKEKQENASSSFTYNSKGFVSEISLEKPQFVFYSVPYSDGWSAEINGQPVDIERVSYGFMAVRADAGDNEIVFRYETPGLKIGIVISAAGIAILIAYILMCRVGGKKKKYYSISHTYDYTSRQKLSSSEQYIEKLTRKRRK
ncbi:MAG: YfhO family protein [Ruminococcus sp.]|nr:YfhO family protein [Ruminococcus sp.]